MINTVSTITSDISSRLAGLSVALMLANTFLVNALSHIDSLLTWIDFFYQELQQGCQSSAKEAWLLVCSYARCYLKDLRKVRDPAQTALNMASASDRTRIALWVLAQSHRISSKFVSRRLREHSVVAGVINRHLFQFVVPLSLRHKLKVEMDSLYKMLNER